MTERKIDDLLHARHRRFTPLAALLGSSSERQLWTDAVRALLPEPLNREVSVINYRAAILIIQASNSSFGTRLRYLLPDLTTKLRNLAAFQDLEQIRIRVSQDVSAPVQIAQPRDIPQSAIDALADLAQTLEAQQDYAELQAVVLRLSGRGKGNRTPK